MEQETLIATLGEWSAGPGPLYRRLAEALRTAIQEGTVPAGTRLPAERVLARALAVSRSTVIAAYEMLEHEGWVESRRGSGTRVRTLSTETHLQQRHARADGLARSPGFERMLTPSEATVDLSSCAPLDLASLDLSPIVPDACEAEELVRTEPRHLPLGWPPLRQAIADHYTRSGLPTTADQILVTAGGQQAIALIGALYLQRGDSVVVEDPAYVGALDIFRSLGARLVPVPVDRDGVRIDILRERIPVLAPRLIHLTPDFHNPTGTVMPATARRAAARLAAEHGIPLSSDDVLVDLSLSDDVTPPLLASYAGDTPILSIGSLNKLFWAGLRVGWIRGPEHVIMRLGRLKALADLGTALLSQAIAIRVLEQFDTLKRRRRADMLARRATLAALLREHLPEWEWTLPAGGSFFWIRLPRGDAREFAQLALRHAVTITPGPALSSEEAYTDHIRIAFIRDSETLQAAVLRLAAAWREYAPLSRQQHTLPVLV